MAFKMNGSPYPKRTKTFTTDASGGVQKTVTRTSKKGDVKSTKVVDYDPTGKRTKKTTTTRKGTRTVEGTGLDAVVTDRQGRTSARRENIKRDVGNVVKGTAQLGGLLAGGVLGSSTALGAKTIAGFVGRVYGGGILGGAIGSDIATRTFGVAGDTKDPRATHLTRGLVEGGIREVKKGVQKVKDLPSNIKKKIHEKRKSKANK
jgi:hypothetical protein